MAKIIIVDDEPSLLAVMRKLLMLNDHTVIEVQESDKAKEMIESEEFDLMISDVRMRPVDGMELLKVALETHPNMNVIMITAFHTEEKSKEALKEGAFAYIPKPFQVTDILSTVQQALANNSRN